MGGGGAKDRLEHALSYMGFLDYVFNFNYNYFTLVFIIFKTFYTSQHNSAVE